MVDSQLPDCSIDRDHASEPELLRFRLSLRDPARPAGASALREAPEQIKQNRPNCPDCAFPDPYKRGLSPAGRRQRYSCRYCGFYFSQRLPDDEVVRPNRTPKAPVPLCPKCGESGAYRLGRTPSGQSRRYRCRGCETYFSEKVFPTCNTVNSTS